MVQRWFAALILISVALAPAVPAGGQSRPAEPGMPAAPRTPWGDPDLQGQWNSQTSTPLQRPAAGPLAGRETLPVEEAATLEATNRANFDLPPREGSVGNYNAFWRDIGRALTRTSLIVDPPDGRIPALSPEGRARIEAERAERSTRGPSNSPGHLYRSQPLDPLRLAGVERHRELVQQQLPDLPDARPRRRLPGAHPRAPHHPARREAASAGVRHPVDGRLARPLGRGHPGRRDHQLRPQDQLPGLARHPASDRTLHAGRRRHHRLPVHGRRPPDVHPAVDRLPAHDPDRGSRVDLRVRRATRGTTPWPASSAAPAPRSGRPARRRPRDDPASIMV